MSQQMTTPSAAPWRDDRPAPNGRPVQENFRAWFGNSKVVNGAALGEHLVRVHDALSALPYASRIRVFGSAARAGADPKDLDVFVDLRGTAATPEQFTALLRIARAHYGLLDPFLRTNEGLLVRNDTATGWTRARNARALEAAIERDSKPLAHVGTPMVVYHGTDADFDVFEFSEDIGFHFGSVTTANSRVLQADMEECSILAIYLSLRNPLRLPDLHTWSPRAVVSALADAGVISGEQADEADVIDREQVAQWLSAKGYDGIVYRNETEGGGDSWIAMYPAQIKSAIGGNGNYDPSNPNITDAQPAPQPMNSPRTPGL